MSAKHRITVNLNQTEYEALQRIAESVDRSLAWLGRKAICDFIEGYERAETPLLAGRIEKKSPARQSAQ